MSADLFAEFTSAPTSNQNQVQKSDGQKGARSAPSFSFFDDLTNTAPAIQPQQPIPTQNFQAPNYRSNVAPIVDENDDWGDFEGGSSFDSPACAPTKPDPFAFPLNQPSAPLRPPSTVNNDPFSFHNNSPSQPPAFTGGVLTSNNDPFSFQTIQSSQPSGPSQSLGKVSAANDDPFAFQSMQPTQSLDSSRVLGDPSPANNDPFEFPSMQSSQPLQSPGMPPEVNYDPFAFQSSQSAQPPAPSWQKAPVIKAKKSADPSVLFDAEDNFDDDDDFGDFEGTESTPGASATTQTSTGLADLMGNLSASEDKSSVNNRKGTMGEVFAKSPGLASARKPSTGGFGSMSNTKKQLKASSPSEPKQDDAWDTFDDWEATIPVKATPKITSKPQPTKGIKSPDLPATILSPEADVSAAGELPPTNVPPPTVLLSLFPPLFAEAQNQLFKPMAAQTLPMRNKILSEPATIAFLQGYLMLGSVAARVIAGRKLRWKRDQHLSQGMRIGPASSRATSGMKLTGIDKSENMKEEREASDVVRAWKDQIGRLRHVVSAANQIKSGTLGSIPDIQEAMPVRTLKQAEGGVPASQPCMMCGLKRDERVTAADHAVEDSFGEWWIDQVNMHRGCRNFWNEYRDRLRQR